MRVIEAQCSWSWRLTITSHIKHDRAAGARQNHPICEPQQVIIRAPPGRAERRVYARALGMDRPRSVTAGTVRPSLRQGDRRPSQ
jgi:hypothetical protein